MQTELNLPPYLVQASRLHRLQRARQQSQAARLGDLPFEDFCEQKLVVQNKAGQIVPLRLNRAQRHLAAHLTGRDLVLKARQLGMSTTIQARLFHKQMSGHARTYTLCHDDQLTSTLRRMVDRFYDNLPKSDRPARRFANARLTTYPALHSEGSIATVGGRAGRSKGRGESVTDIHGSEVAFWPDAESVLSAAMQAGNPDIILESTANGMTGWFYEQCMDALNGNSPWTLHFFPWWWDDEYRLPLEGGEALDYTDEEQALVSEHGLDAEQIKWRRNKQRELRDLFPQEYPEDPYSCFLASGTSYFGDVEHVFTAPAGATPIPGRRYVAGLDFGQTTDYTVMSVMDAAEMVEVAILRINRMSWADQRQRIAEMARRWNNCEVHAEANSIGDPNIEELHAAGVRVVAFKTTAQSKPPLIQGLYVALHEAGLRLLDDPAGRHELRSFISKQTANGHWQYQAQEGSHDDTVMARALAWHGAHNPMTIEFAPNPFFGG